ncbi:MAG: hypothetical protein ACKON7_07800 [Planctomycetaceae bacterium]
MPPAARTAAILAAITFAVFSPTLSANFVYDARLQILTDPFPHDPRNWPAVLSFAVLGMDVLDFNRPVHLASIMLDAALWGRDPFGYHLTSILLHCGNVVLLWLVLRDVVPRTGRGGAALETDESAVRGLTPTSVAAFAGAILFAVHPLVTEAVCEPTFREDLLVAAFTLGAIVLASRCCDSLHGEQDDGSPGVPRLLPGARMESLPSPERQRRDSGLLSTSGPDSHSPAPWRAVACAACCLFACASKESGIAAPVVLGAYWWLFHRGADRRFWTVALGGGAALSLAFLAARFLLEPETSRIFDVKPEYPGGSLAAALALEPRILALYAQLVACPVYLCADYGGPSVAHLPLPLAIAVVAALGAALAWLGWRDRRIAFGTALMLLPLVPVSNLVPIYRAAADRYLYLPLAGVAVIVACFVARSWSRASRERRQIGLGVGLVALGLLAAACMARQRVWSNSMALWTDTLTRNPASYSAASGLAAAFREAGQFTESERAARHALVLSGSSRGDTWVSLALALEGQGRTVEADAAVATALENDPRLADPDARVAALALERAEADGVKALLARRPARATAETPAKP